MLNLLKSIFTWPHTRTNHRLYWWQTAWRTLWFIPMQVARGIFCLSVLCGTLSIKTFERAWEQTK
jgi:hypothetical protein